MKQFFFIIMMAFAFIANSQTHLLREKYPTFVSVGNFESTPNAYLVETLEPFDDQATQTLTLAADSTNATFNYNLDAAHEYKLTIEGFYKTPWVTIRPAFNPDNQFTADWSGEIIYAPTPNLKIIKNHVQTVTNQTHFEVPYLMETRKVKLTNVWIYYKAQFDISNITSSGTYTLFLNNNMGDIGGPIVWKTGTSISLIQK